MIAWQAGIDELILGKRAEVEGVGAGAVNVDRLRRVGVVTRITAR
jgi:hypothetical protein